MKDWAKDRAKNNNTQDRDAEFGFLSFRLHDAFIKQFTSLRPNWGFEMGAGNTLGEWSWFTKYSRVKADGTKERFYEGLRRVIEGMYSIQKDWALRNRLPWNEQQARVSAQEAYIRAFQGKWSPPGRGFWMMGTEFVNARQDSSALQNCAFLSTASIETELATPFATLMNMSMLGIGVGFDTLGAGTVSIHEPKNNYRKAYVIEDSREGWCDSTARLLNSYFKPGQWWVEFDYGDIRPAGWEIHGFGGTSAGPEPLIKLHRMLRSLLENRDGQKLTSSDIVDIMNMIGKCVVAANVRSSAEIALGSPHDSDFLALKDWRVNPERMGSDGWGYTSNNSVVVRTGDDISHLVEGITLNGEPGIIWMDVIRRHGRVGDWNDKDKRAVGVNPCLTGDTWIMTANGPIQIADLKDPFVAIVSGDEYKASASWSSGIRDVFKLTTKEGYEVSLTYDHKIRKTDSTWVKAGELQPGDKIVLNNHRNIPDWTGAGSWDEGYLCGLFKGDGNWKGLKNNGGIPLLHVWPVKDSGSQGMLDEAYRAAKNLNWSRRSDWAGWSQVSDTDYQAMSIPRKMVESFGFDDSKNLSAAIEQTSTAFHCGFLRGLFDADSSVRWGKNSNGIIDKGTNIDLSQSDYPGLVIVQRMLLRLGIRSKIYPSRKAGHRMMPNGKGGNSLYPHKDQWRLVISGDDTAVFAAKVGFSHIAKSEKLNSAISSRTRAFYGKPFSVTVKSFESIGRQKVFDLTVDIVHAMDANGLYVSNCGEQPLENHELCTLVETYPTNHDSLEDYCRTLKFAYLYGKTVTLLPTQWPETNEVMQRNRRIGTSMTGIAQFADERGWAELKRWQLEGYNVIREWDETYSEWLGVRESVRVTTVKPSGTVSLLFGVTPGCHWPKESGYYVRTVRENKTNPIVNVMRQAGYRVEPNKVNPEHGVVIYLPVIGPDMRAERDVSVWEKIALAAHCQQHWSDNSVSVTVTFNPLHEQAQIAPILRVYDGKLKTVSFLPDTPGVYDQAPYQKVTRREWYAMHDAIMPLDWEALYRVGLEPTGEKYCSNDTCEVYDGE